MAISYDSSATPRLMRNPIGITAIALIWLFMALPIALQMTKLGVAGMIVLAVTIANQVSSSLATIAFNLTIGTISLLITSVTSVVYVVVYRHTQIHALVKVTLFPWFLGILVKFLSVPIAMFWNEFFP